MKAITESFLRYQFRKGFPDTFHVEGGSILTPSAAQLLAERGVKVVEGAAPEAAPQSAAMAASVAPTPPQLRYVVAGGGQLAEKPVHMTLMQGHAAANILVEKDHPRIFLRGALERLLTKAMLLRRKAHDLGRTKLCGDLGQIEARLRGIRQAELLDHALLPADMLGLSEERLAAEARALSGLELEYDSDETALAAHELYGLLHEAESLAVRAFRREFELERPEIIRALNLLGLAVKLIVYREAKHR